MAALQSAARKPAIKPQSMIQRGAPLKKPPQAELDTKPLQQDVAAEPGMQFTPEGAPPRLPPRQIPGQPPAPGPAPMDPAARLKQLQMDRYMKNRAAEEAGQGGFVPGASPGTVRFQQNRPQAMMPWGPGPGNAMFDRRRGKPPIERMGQLGPGPRTMQEGGGAPVSMGAGPGSAPGQPTMGPPPDPMNPVMQGPGSSPSLGALYQRPNQMGPGGPPPMVNGGTPGPLPIGPPQLSGGPAMVPPGGPGAPVEGMSGNGVPFAAGPAGMPSPGSPQYQAMVSALQNQAPQTVQPPPPGMPSVGPGARRPRPGPAFRPY